MANGNGIKITLPEVVKNSILGMFCAGLMAMMWYGWMAPGVNERKAMTENFRRSIDSMEKQAESSEKIALNTEDMKTMIGDIKTEIAGQTDLRMQAMDTMNAFATEMREVNPANAKKLDKVVNEDHPRMEKKLDVVIEQTKPEGP